VNTPHLNPSQYSSSLSINRLITSSVTDGLKKNWGQEVAIIQQTAENFRDYGCSKFQLCHKIPQNVFSEENFWEKKNFFADRLKIQGTIAPWIPPCHEATA